MTEAIHDYGMGFHHIRGEFRIAGMLNVGTHCALVKTAPGEFVFLDSYTLPPAIHEEVKALTDDGAKVKAIVNLHPFHTLHCEWMHHAFPEATLYGTQRHHEKLPQLPWANDRCEGGVLDGLFGKELEFTQPDGVHLVCERENVHFSSILAFHPASGTIFVDDTLSRAVLPFPLSLLPMNARLDFHPTLLGALKDEPHAANAFHDWAVDMAVNWAGARRIAMAHNTVLDLGEEELPTLIGEALARAKPVLDKHRARFA